MSEADVQRFMPVAGERPDLTATVLSRKAQPLTSAGTGAEHGPAQWPDPAPLGGALPAVPAFSLELLPASLRPLVADIAERMQIPADVPAAFTVLCLAGCVNRRASIQPKARDTSWTVIPLLWGAVIQGPGYLKSPALQACIARLEKIEAQWRAENAEELKAWELEREKAELELAVWRESFKRAKKRGGPEPEKPDGAPEQPVSRRLIVCDPTYEKLQEIMARNPAGVLLARDELTGWLATLERQGREGERQFYLETWNGHKSYTVDRIGRGSIHVPACCLSIVGGIQPGRFRSYLADALKDGPANDGLIQRLQILVWPDAGKQWELVDRPPDRQAEDRAARVFKTLAEMPADPPQRLAFSAEAQGLFYKWWTELEGKLRGDELHPALVSHLAKYRSLMPSLALLFELADAAAGEYKAESVSLQHAGQAAEWCDYLESHARRVYSSIVTPELRAAQTLGEKIKAKVLAGVFTVRDVYLKGWSGLDSPERAIRALEVSEDAGWVRLEPAQPGVQGGRPSPRYRVNPKVWR